MSRRVEEIVQKLAALLPLGVAFVRDGCLVWASERLLELTGRDSPEALLGIGVEDLLADSGQGLPGSQRRRQVECALRRSDGRERTVVWRPLWPEIAARTDAWSVEDASHVRSLERELLHMGRELKRLHGEAAVLRERERGAQLEREELLTVVSHELRTPLTVIGGYHRLLLSEQVGPLGDEQRGFLEESARSCRRLDEFVEKLLASARQPGGGEVLELATGSLAPAIEEATRGLAPLLEQRGLELSLRLEPGSRARFDRRALDQILTNLLSNAVRHAAGAIEIASRRLPAAGGRALVEIAISDDGPGVAAENRRRIFEPYVQGGDPGRAGGLGLGLAICRRLVEAHGGAIAVAESAQGGACFAFSLPEAEV